MQNAGISMKKTQENAPVLNFEHLNFDIVSGFVLRIFSAQINFLL